MGISNETIEMIIPNNYDILPVVIESASKIAGLMGFDDQDTRKIELGVEEAVGNIIKYAFDKGDRSTVRIVFSLERLGLGISVFEKGIPFDPSLVAEFSPEKFNKDLSDEGLGMYLLKQFMDEFSFINHGKQGKETRLFKYLHNSDIEQLMDEAEKEKALQEREEEKLPAGSIKYSVRRMLPEEAVEVSRCAYTSYGYSYANEAFYYPERVREMNATEDVISFVAINRENDEVMAHCALEREEDRQIPQMGVAATKPRYRGQGCLNNLNVALLHEAEKQNFTGVFAYCISTHFFSQKAMLKHQLMPCAFMASFGPEMKFKEIDQKIMQRESVFIQFKYLLNPGEHYIYPPRKHEKMIRKMYGFIGGDPEIRTIAVAPELPRKSSVLRVNTNASLVTASIFVIDYGEDLVKEIADITKRLCRDRIMTIYLYLKLADPLTAVAVEDTEEQGFFFSGIKPGSHNGDMLIMQYLNNHVIDYDYIAAGCDESKEILDYIRKTDPNYQVQNESF